MRDRTRGGSGLAAVDEEEDGVGEEAFDQVAAAAAKEDKATDEEATQDKDEGDISPAASPPSSVGQRSGNLVSSLDPVNRSKSPKLTGLTRFGGSRALLSTPSPSLQLALRHGSRLKHQLFHPFGVLRADCLSTEMPRVRRPLARRLLPRVSLRLPARALHCEFVATLFFPGLTSGSGGTARGAAGDEADGNFVPIPGFGGGTNLGNEPADPPCPAKSNEDAVQVAVQTAGHGVILPGSVIEKLATDL